MRAARATRVGYWKLPRWRVDGWADADANDWLWLDQALDAQFDDPISQIEKLRTADNRTYLHYAEKKEDPPPSKKQRAASPNVIMLPRVKGKHDLQSQSTHKAAARILAAVNTPAPTR